MKKTKILISVTAIILVAIITTSIISVFTYTSDGLPAGSPKSINVYYASTSETTYEKGTENYNKILKGYTQMTRFSLFNQVASGFHINEKTNQDLSGNSSWSETNKLSSGWFSVEFIYDENQKVVVEVDGNTRVITFRSLIFLIDNSDERQDLKIYFSTLDTRVYNTSESKAYPFIVQAKTADFYNTLQEIRK